MSKYTCDPMLELHGQSAWSLLECVDFAEIAPLLKGRNLTVIDPGRWYSAQDILDVISHLASSQNATSKLVAIGIKFAEYVWLPPETERLSFEDFMLNCDALYQAAHRNGNAGGIVTEYVGPKHVVCRVSGPHPDDLVYGMFFGYARRLLPPHAYFTVYYDEDIPRRDVGGEETVIHVAWND